ncbi:MAG: hypothetical protein HYV09_21200 [Deltaproteobacteria bacterium]|nr:hypothetical protein [Deltaproteobacteria bacterium]
MGAAGAASAAVAPPATADESLTPKEVLAVMVKRRVEIRKLCWEDSKQKADASVRVDFVVAQTGVVTEATPREVSGPPSISECVVAEVKRTTFPTSEKGGRFRWPFIFKGP